MTEPAIHDEVRVHDHALALMRQFDDEPVDVVLASVTLFLFHVYRAALEPEHVTFDEFAMELGAALGRVAEDARALGAKES